MGECIIVSSLDRLLSSCFFFLCGCVCVCVYFEMNFFYANKVKYWGKYERRHALEASVV